MTVGKKKLAELSLLLSGLWSFLHGWEITFIHVFVSSELNTSYGACPTEELWNQGNKINGNDLRAEEIILKLKTFKAFIHGAGGMYCRALVEKKHNENQNLVQR